MPPSGAAGEAGAGEAGAPSGGGVAGSGAGGSGALGGMAGSGVGGQAEGGGGGSDVVPEPDPTLALSAIYIAQTLEEPLMLDGETRPAAERLVPLVAGKRALVRAFVELEPGFVGRELIGVLDLRSPSGDDTLVDRRVVSASSTQDDLSSTFTFPVLARDLEPATKYRLRVLEADTTLLARYPDSGYLPLSAQLQPELQVVMVPMVANGIAPKAGPEEVAAFRKRLVGLFPATDAVLSVAEPVIVPGAFGPLDDNALDAALEQLLDVRDAAKPADEVFFYGMLAPAATYDTYCKGGSCNLGLSYVADANDVVYRGSIGISVFPDGSGAQDAWDTAAHELGHALGRQHAPCGNPDGPDSDFPYPGGNLGMIYGVDLDVPKLLKPRQYKDVMSYCTPVWISDYTYRGLVERLTELQSQGFRTLSFAQPERFRVARIGAAGASSWRGDRSGRPGASQGGEAYLLDQRGQRLAVVPARLRALDHLAGGSVWLRAADLVVKGAVFVDLRPLGGGVLAL